MIFKNYKKWSKPTKIGIWIGVLSIILTMIGFILQIFPSPKTYKINVFSGSRHLGDNIFARVGGESLPKWDDPLAEMPDYDLIYYDKETKRFLSRWGQPLSVQKLVFHYGNIYKKFNLEAWENIFSTSEEPINTYPGQTVKIDSETFLTWKEKKGNFYYRYAVVGRVAILNLYKELSMLGVDLEKAKPKKINLVFSGMHGGKRADQNENIELVINDKIYPFEFSQLFTRQEEVIKYNIEIKNIIISKPNETYLSIFVLPFQEVGPLPPPNSEYLKEGPSHFRDIEIEGIYLEIVI